MPSGAAQTTFPSLAAIIGVCCANREIESQVNLLVYFLPL
jgi:hypothetical protein